MGGVAVGLLQVKSTRGMLRCAGEAASTRGRSKCGDVQGTRLSRLRQLQMAGRCGGFRTFAAGMSFAMRHGIHPTWCAIGPKPRSAGEA